MYERINRMLTGQGSSSDQGHADVILCQGAHQSIPGTLKHASFHASFCRSGRFHSRAHEHSNSSHLTVSFQRCTALMVLAWKGGFQSRHSTAFKTRRQTMQSPGTRVLSAKLIPCASSKLLMSCQGPCMSSTLIQHTGVDGD